VGLDFKQHERGGPLLNFAQQIAMMNRSNFLTIAALAALPFASSCGSGSETTDGTAPADDAAATACACLQEKLGKLNGVLAAEGNDAWTPSQWTTALADESSPCMQTKGSAEADLAAANLEKDCPGFDEYKAKIKEFSDRLSAAQKAAKEEKVQDIQELTGGGGARDLLDQLSNKGKQ